MKKVTFNNHPTIIYEPSHLVQDLREARKSNHLQRQADKCRMERLLAPVFETEFRKKMYHMIVKNQPKL